MSTSDEFNIGFHFPRVQCDSMDFEYSMPVVTKPQMAPKPQFKKKPALPPKPKIRSPRLSFASEFQIPFCDEPEELLLNDQSSNTDDRGSAMYQRT